MVCRRIAELRHETQSRARENDWNVDLGGGGVVDAAQNHNGGSDAEHDDDHEDHGAVFNRDENGQQREHDADKVDVLQELDLGALLICNGAADGGDDDGKDVGADDTDDGAHARAHAVNFHEVRRKEAQALVSRVATEHDETGKPNLGELEDLNHADEAFLRVDLAFDRVFIHQEEAENAENHEDDRVEGDGSLHTELAFSQLHADGESGEGDER